MVVSTKHCQVFKADPVFGEDPYHPSLHIDFPVEKCIQRNFNFVDSQPSYNFKKANLNGLYISLLNIDWSFLHMICDVNEACTAFYGKLYEHLDLYVPKTTIRAGSKFPPWFTPDLKSQIKLKYHFWKKYKSSLDVSDYLLFKNCRSSIKKNTLTAYREYIQHTELQIQHDPRQFWSYIRSKKNSRIPGHMSYEGTSLSFPIDIVNAFANYFSGSYSCPSDSSDFCPTADLSSLMVGEVGEGDVLGAICKLKPKLSQGPDGIPGFLVTDCRYVFLSPLVYIFNLALQCSSFPDVWKVSKICPVFKKGDRACVEDYRPVSLLCNFAKVFEYVLFSVVSPHVNHYISDNQHGFVKNRSTLTNLCTFCQYSSLCLDRRGHVDAIYFDFTKAFDFIDHKILIHKLSAFGFSLSLIEFFKSYLLNRLQYVFYAGCSSYKFVALSGVPQGSILGPMLFNIFINDLDSHLTVNRLFYADDVKIFSSINSITDCELLQDNINIIVNWCSVNNLRLNTSKCKVLTFSNGRDPFVYDYLLDTEIVSRVSSIVDLGVTFDSGLRFHLHIAKILTDASKSLGFVIRNSKHFHSSKTFILLYNSFVRSRLEYCSLCWLPFYGCYKSLMESIQRKFLKFLSFFEDKEYPVRGFSHALLLDRFSFESLERRRMRHALSFLFKLVHGDIHAPYLFLQLSFRDRYYINMVTRNDETFTLPIPNTNLLIKSPIYFTCSIYNKCPSHLLTKCTSLADFVTQCMAVL